MKLTTHSLLVVVLCASVLCSASLYAKERGELSLFFDDAEMVEVGNRYPKPLSQVAEQVTVYTAEDIERSHVHTIGQFLAEVPGLFIEFVSPDIGQVANINSLGSRNYHTLVLVDGVRQNIGANGTPLINGLAPSIVKKIEIIKGPASSAWGSSLGGVINIITKETGDTTSPTGMVTVSGGEGPYHGVNGDVRGKFAKLGYYFNFDHIDSDGLWRNRYTRKEAFYGKFKLALAHDIKLGLTYSDSFPRYKSMEWPANNRQEHIRNRNRFGSLSLDAPFAQSFHLHVDLNRFVSDFTREQHDLGTNANLWNEEWDGTATDGSVRISWAGKKHSAVLGAETRRSTLDYIVDVWPGPSRTLYPTALEDQHSVYTNAALNFGDLTLTPSIRYDINSNSSEIVSPSLGAVYRLNMYTNVRATVARGFSAPYLFLLYSPYGGNRSLAKEVILSYQAGIETNYFEYLHITATIFHHRVEDAWDVSNYANNGRIRRVGGEFYIETLPWHKLTFKASFAVTSEDGKGYNNEKTYGSSLGLLFDDPKLCRVKLNGRYVKWNKFIISDTPGTYDDFVWDIVVDKEIMARENYRAEVFMSVHNIFNASQAWDVDYDIPQRWVEGGLTVHF